MSYIEENKTTNWKRNVKFTFKFIVIVTNQTNYKNLINARQVYNVLETNTMINVCDLYI